MHKGQPTEPYQPRLPPSSYSSSKRRKHPLCTKCSLIFRHCIVTTLMYGRHYYTCFVEDETERSDTFAYTTERGRVRIRIQVPLTLQAPIHHVATATVYVTVNICTVSHFHNSQFSQLLLSWMYSFIIKQCLCARHSQDTNDKAVSEQHG